MAERRSSVNPGNPDQHDEPPAPGGFPQGLGRALGALLGRAGPTEGAAPAAAPDPAVEAAALRRRVAGLEAALEQARALAESKTELLTTMTHELRTPMNGMMGMAHLLLETELDRDQRGMVEVLLHAGEGLLDLVNDTLDFSRVEAGKLALERLPFDLRLSADEVGSLLAPMANEKGLHLECTVRHEVPSRLVGDPGRLRQVLLNLGGNAVKFTERGRVTLEVERLAEHGESVTLRFSVGDTGIGMDEETRARIFQAFEQGDASIARRFGGTGLGLAISSRLVALMGGRVGVESAPGEGSRFWFDVTFEKQAGALPEDGPVPADLSLAGARVLVVEPSAAMRRSYVAKLCARGCRVEPAGDAAAALARLCAAAGEGDPFRFALIERELPDTGGEDLGAAIRADALHDRTLTVLVTSAGQRGDAARARARGFAAYVSKPLDWDRLARLLVETRRRAESAPPGEPPPLVTMHSMAEAQRARLRVLLVEDSAVNQLVTQWTLQRLGYGLQVAPTAAAALAAWERGPFDLVLLDLRLPDGDGRALAAELRSRGVPGRRVPIVAMTGSADPGERERCLAAGMDDFLPKPVDLGQLCSVIERLTRAAGPAGEPAAERVALAAGDAPLLGEIEAAEADICGLARSAAAPGPAGTAAAGGPADARVDERRAAVAEAELDAVSGAMPVVKTLSSADVVPLGAGPAPDADGPRPPLDLERLEQSSMGVPALRDSLLATFLADVRPRLEQLGQAVVTRDARRVEFEAHGLKGMCLTVGAGVCGELFAEMEWLGREQRLDETGPLLKRAHLEVIRTERFIATLERAAA